METHGLHKWLMTALMAAMFSSMPLLFVSGWLEPRLPTWAYLIVYYLPLLVGVIAGVRAYRRDRTPHETENRE